MADSEQIMDGVDMAATAAAAVIPGVAAFVPLIELLLTAIRAHFNATGEFPTEEQVKAAVPLRAREIQALWSGYVPSGDGSLSAPK